MSTAPSKPPPTKSHRWWWFFIALAVVGGSLLLWLILYIRHELDPSRQLNLEKLKIARDLWKAQRIVDYDMLYQVRRGKHQPDKYYVEVRGGAVRTVVHNGVTHLEPKVNHSMHGLFNDIEIFLKRDAEPNAQPTYCRGWFDSEDGHLLQFVRRVTGGDESVEIKVETFKPLPSN